MKRKYILHGILPFLFLNLICTGVFYVLVGALGGASMAVIDGAVDHESFSYQVMINTMWAVLFLQPILFFVVWRRMLRKEKAATSGQPTKTCKTDEKTCFLSKSYAGTILFLVLTAGYYAVYFNLPDIQMNTGSSSIQTLQIVQNVRSMHATLGNLEEGLNEISLANDGAIPPDMLDDRKNPTKVESTWLKPITIRNAPAPFDRQAFVITFTAAPQKICTSLINKLAGSGMDTGLTQVVVGGKPPVTQLPVTQKEADSLCDQKSQDVAFQFNLKG